MNPARISRHSNLMRTFLALLFAVVSLAAHAEGPVLTKSVEHLGPFDRMFGIGAYATGWAGSYGAYGVGARVRLEPWSWVGVDLFGEAFMVTTPHGIRHDHPVGFNLYMPIRLGESMRIRPLIGMCVVASFIEPTEPQAPRADDVLVGAHAGGAFEVALGKRVSLFAEAKAVVWVGHDRTVQGWTGAVGNQVQPFVVGQGQVGIMVHLGSR